MLHVCLLPVLGAAVLSPESRSSCCVGLVEPETSSWLLSGLSSTPPAGANRGDPRGDVGSTKGDVERTQDFFVLCCALTVTRAHALGFHISMSATFISLLTAVVRNLIMLV